MFITINDCRNGNEHFINLNHIAQIKQEKDLYVIELNDYDGSLIHIDKDTYTSIKRILERMG